MESVKKVEKLLRAIQTTDILRKENRKRLKELYKELNIKEKVGEFEEIFTFLAINLTGISLQQEQLGLIQPKRYIQIIGIKKEENRSKNISLGYFGKAENIDERKKHNIVEFVLRWRLEKSFMNADHYRELLRILDARKVE